MSTEREYEFATPVFGYVACSITARNAKEAREAFESGDFQNVFHMEFEPISTPVARRKLAKKLASDD